MWLLYTEKTIPFKLLGKCHCCRKTNSENLVMYIYVHFNELSVSCFSIKTLLNCIYQVKPALVGYSVLSKGFRVSGIVNRFQSFMSHIWQTCYVPYCTDIYLKIIIAFHGFVVLIKKIKVMANSFISAILLQPTSYVSSSACWESPRDKPRSVTVSASVLSKRLAYGLQRLHDASVTFKAASARLPGERCEESA